MFKFSNCIIFKLAHLQIVLFSNLQIEIFRNRHIFKFSNFQIDKSLRHIMIHRLHIIIFFQAVDQFIDVDDLFFGYFVKRLGNALQFG